MNEPNRTNTLANYIAAKDLPERSNGLISPAATAWLLRNRNTNGLANIVKKINGKLYLHYPGFCQWFEQQSAR